MKKILSAFTFKKISASLTMLALLFSVTISSSTTLDLLIPDADACSCYNYFPSGLGNPFSETVDVVFDAAIIGFQIFNEGADNTGDAIIDFTSSGGDFVIDTVIPSTTGGSTAPPASWSYFKSGQKVFFSNMKADGGQLHNFIIKGKFTSTGAHSIIHTEEAFNLTLGSGVIDQNCNNQSRSGTINPAAPALTDPTASVAPSNTLVIPKFNTGVDVAHDYTLTIDANDVGQTIDTVSLSCTDWSITGATSGATPLVTTVRHIQKAEDNGTELCQVDFTDSGVDNNSGSSTLNFTSLDQELSVTNDGLSVLLSSGKTLSTAGILDFTDGEQFTINYTTVDGDDLAPPYSDVTVTNIQLPSGISRVSADANPRDSNTNTSVTYEVNTDILELGGSIIEEFAGYYATKVSEVQVGASFGSSRHSSNSYSTGIKFGDTSYLNSLKFDYTDKLNLDLEYNTYGSAYVDDGERACWKVVLDGSGRQIGEIEGSQTRSGTSYELSFGTQDFLDIIGKGYTSFGVDYKYDDGSHSSADSQLDDSSYEFGFTPGFGVNKDFTFDLSYEYIGDKDLTPAESEGLNAAKDYAKHTHSGSLDSANQGSSQGTRSGNINYTSGF